MELDILVKNLIKFNKLDYNAILPPKSFVVCTSSNTKDGVPQLKEVLTVDDNKESTSRAFLNYVLVNDLSRSRKTNLKN